LQNGPPAHKLNERRRKLVACLPEGRQMWSFAKLTFAFVIGQAFYLGRYMQQETPGGES
jgi:hypothetical protein